MRQFNPYYAGRSPKSFRIGRLHKSGFCLSLFFCFDCSVQVRAGSIDRELFRLAVDANAASVNSIRTFYGRVKVLHVKDQSINPEGEYWRIGKRDRYRCRVDERFLERATDGSINQGFSQGQRDGQPYMGGTIVRDDVPSPFNPWHLGLLTQTGPTNTKLTISDLVSGPHELIRAEEAQVDARRFVVIELRVTKDFGPLTMELWLDPKVNYLVSKYVGKTNQSARLGLQPENEVIHFLEPKPGLFFPGRVEKRWNGKVESIVTFSDLRVNEPMAESALAIRYPRGIQISDSIQKKVYVADEYGNLIGETKFTLDTSPPLTVELRNEQALYTTPSDPVASSSRYILPVSLAMLALAGVLWLVRLRGRQTA